MFAVAATVLTPGFASAQLFELTYQNGSYGNADVFLTGVAQGGGLYEATSASGTLGALTVTGLDTNFAFADNLFRVGTGTIIVSQNGISFDVSNGDAVNVSYLNGAIQETTAFYEAYVPVTNPTISPVATPEPAPVAALGLGALGLLVRRRRAYPAR